MCRLMFCNASDDLDERKYLQCMALVSKMSFSTQQGHHFGPSCICCNHTCICIFPASGFAVFFLQFAFFNFISLHLKTNDQTSFIILLDLCPTIFSIFHVHFPCPFSMSNHPHLQAIRDAKSEEHEERAPAIFPPAVLIFGLPT